MATATFRYIGALLDLAAALSYQLGYLTGCAVHARSAQLSMLFVAFLAPTATEAQQAPVEPAAAPEITGTPVTLPWTREITLRVDGVTPAVDGVVPAVSEVVAAVDGVVPAVSEVVAAVDGVVPAVSEVVAAVDGVVPATKPTFKCVAPEGGVVTECGLIDYSNTAEARAYYAQQGKRAERLQFERGVEGLTCAQLRLLLPEADAAYVTRKRFHKASLRTLVYERFAQGAVTLRDLTCVQAQPAAA